MKTWIPLALMLSISPTLLADYNRSDWKHWIDKDRDCQNTRAEILIRDSISPVTFKTDRSCTVETGQWHLPYTGDISFSARDIDIDHVIPLKWANDHGGESWDSDKKKAFANDPENLLSTKAGANRSKGAKGPEEWIPTVNKCTYAIQWKYLLKKYQLDIQVDSQTALTEMCSI